MLESNISVRSLANTPANMGALVAIGEKRASNDYHILRNSRRLVLITHYTWERCDFCNSGADENGIIDMR